MSLEWLVSFRDGTARCSYCERWLLFHCENCSPERGHSVIHIIGNPDGTQSGLLACDDCLTELQNAFVAEQGVNE